MPLDTSRDNMIFLQGIGTAHLDRIESHMCRHFSVATYCATLFRTVEILCVFGAMKLKNKSQRKNKK